MSKITIVAKLLAKKDSLETVKAELLKMLAPTKKEQGCIEYRLHQDNEKPDQFVFYENWENMECLQQHIESQHYKDYIAAVDGLIVEKTVNQMNEIEK